MISKKLRSVACAMLVWILGVSCYLLSFYLPVLENPDLQSNSVLALAIIPSACLGTYLFYKKSYIKPALFALVVILVATSLDALLTVPLFIIPSGGSYASFFGDAMFYIILVELYVTVWYFGNYITQNVKA